MWNGVSNYIEQSVIKKLYLSIYAEVQGHSVPIKVFNAPFNNISLLHDYNAGQITFFYKKPYGKFIFGEFILSHGANYRVASKC